MRASVDANSGVSVLTAREDAGLEWVTTGVLLVLKLIPDLTGKVLAEERGSACWEDREASKVID